MDESQTLICFYWMLGKGLAGHRTAGRGIAQQRRCSAKHCLAGQSKAKAKAWRPAGISGRPPGTIGNVEMKMKAISLHQPWASMIVQGSKTIETRTWYTEHVGDLLIVSTQKPELPGFLCGYALCVVNLIDCRKMTIEDQSGARVKWRDDLWAWVLNDIRPVIEPFRVRGYQGIYELEVED